MKILILVLLSFSVLFFLGCRPSQKQVNEAVKKIMDEREEEKQRVFKYIDEYAKTKGLPSGPGQQAQGRPPQPSIDEQIKNPKKVELGPSPTKGPKNAPITIVEFSDFQCPFCSRVLPTLDNLMKKYPGKIKLVFKNQPLPMHPNAKVAAQAGLAAHRQGKFWPMHDLMFKNPGRLDRASLVDFAKQLGLSEMKFARDLDDPQIIKQIEEEFQWANSNGLGGTPSFLINGVTLVGAQPEDRFSEVIDKLLK